MVIITHLTDAKEAVNQTDLYFVVRFFLQNIKSPCDIMQRPATSRLIVVSINISMNLPAASSEALDPKRE